MAFPDDARFLRRLIAGSHLASCRHEPHTFRLSTGVFKVRSTDLGNGWRRCSVFHETAQNPPDVQSERWRQEIPDAGVAGILHQAIVAAAARAAPNEAEGLHHCDMDYLDDQAVILDLTLATEVLIWPPSHSGSTQCRSLEAHG